MLSEKLSGRPEIYLLLTVGTQICDGDHLYVICIDKYAYNSVKEKGKQQVYLWPVGAFTLRTMLPSSVLFDLVCITTIQDEPTFEDRPNLNLNILHFKAKLAVYRGVGPLY